MVAPSNSMLAPMTSNVGINAGSSGITAQAASIVPVMTTSVRSSQAQRNAVARDGPRQLDRALGRQVEGVLDGHGDARRYHERTRDYVAGQDDVFRRPEIRGDDR